jgi:hypothetical protein
MNHWIVSYGTLINKRITEKTGKSFAYIPCKIKDHVRRWSFSIPKEQRSAAGIEGRKGVNTTGALVSILESELDLFDDREKGYERVKVKDLSILNPIKGEVPEGEYWMYIPIDPKIPTLRTPIAQTMVDVMVSACLDVSTSFAKECIMTTLDWEFPWINDRKNPLYPRYLENLPIEKIDNILMKTIPYHFAQRNET